MNSDNYEPTAKMLLAGSMVDWKKYPNKEDAARDVWKAMMRNAAYVVESDELHDGAFKAAKQAYDQKWADMNGPYPTEEPESGLGPLGYAIRAYFFACKRENEG